MSDEISTTTVRPPKAGRPGGATGVYQIAEAYLQLTGQAGENQLKNTESR